MKNHKKGTHELLVEVHKLNKFYSSKLISSFRFSMCTSQK